MSSKRAAKLVFLLSIVIALVMIAPVRVAADDDDPPTRVARLAYAQGSVSFQPAGTEDWVGAILNRPITTGDQVWSDADGRVELQLDGSLIRLSNNTGLSFLNLADNVTQIQLSTGTLLVRVRRLDDNETYEIDTPNLAFSILRPGTYRLSVDPDGNTTVIKVRSGEGEVTGGGAAFTVHANEYDIFSGTDQLNFDQQQYTNDEDQFETWGASRDARWERSQSSRYVSADVVGYEDLDDQGSWRPSPEYGNVWFPRVTESGWAPYHNGHWAYIEPWGYTWVDDEQWGYAPFHYGRWVSVNGAWGWVPSPPQTQGVVYVRPVYAPALVAWVGVGANVAWFALGPREVYVPSYPVSRNYVNNINVSNTTVTTVVVNNYYNTTVVNKTVNVTNVRYVNQTVPGAVAATTSQAFSTAQPVARNVVVVDQRAIASAQVRTFTPTVVPAKQAVLGSGRVSTFRPPAAVQARTVVAKSAPPPPPLSFEKRQAAIKNNDGRPLTAAQVHQIQPAATQRVAAVKIAPPAKPTNVAANKGGQPNKPATVAAENHPGQVTAPPQTPNRPVDQRTAVNTSAPNTKPNPAPVHPNEIPMPPARTPPATNSALDQKHQQEQQQLVMKQQQERERIQQEQDREHQQQEQQKADEARKMQLEQQHQQQTQQLQQKHAQEQQALQEKQQKEKQQQESKTAPKNTKSDQVPKDKPNPQ
jgi:hypothetical protein